MMQARRAFLLLFTVTCALAAPACGDDDAAENPDAEVVVIPPDASPPDAAPDAAPEPDARPADLSCADDKAPTPPPAETVHIGGTAQTNNGTSGITALDGATVEAFKSSDANTPVATGTTDASGNFDLAITTGGAAFDGYVRMTKDGKMPVYLYFADAVVADTTANQLVTVDTSLLGQLGGFVDPEKALIAMRLEDCQHLGVLNAEVTLEPAAQGSQIVDLGALSPTFEGGIGAINVPLVEGAPTAYTVKASVSAGSLQDAPVTAYVGSITYIVLHP
jgi:hypothetical protein